MTKSFKTHIIYDGPFSELNILTEWQKDNFKLKSAVRSTTHQVLVLLVLETNTNAKFSVINIKEITPQQSNNVTV